MKKIIILSLCTLGLGFASCKKDRECKCTVTTTASNGNVSTDLDNRTTYIDIRKADAKSRCQNFTNTYVSQSGGTTVVKGECDLN